MIRARQLSSIVISPFLPSDLSDYSLSFLLIAPRSFRQHLSDFILSLLSSPPFLFASATDRIPLFPPGGAPPPANAYARIYRRSSFSFFFAAPSPLILNLSCRPSPSDTLPPPLLQIFCQRFDLFRWRYAKIIVFCFVSQPRPSSLLFLFLKTGLPPADVKSAIMSSTVGPFRLPPPSSVIFFCPHPFFLQRLASALTLQYVCKKVSTPGVALLERLPCFPLALCDVPASVPLHPSDLLSRSLSLRLRSTEF